jgi:DnaJ-class molecular chaperone
MAKEERLMDDDKPVPTKPCEVCEGSGQVCEFRGVSRFVLTWEDCPACGGMGVIPDQAEPEKRNETP